MRHPWTKTTIIDDGQIPDGDRVVIVKIEDTESYTHVYDTLRLVWPRYRPTLDPGAEHYIRIEVWRKAGWTVLHYIPREGEQGDARTDLDRAIDMAQTILA